MRLSLAIKTLFRSPLRTLLTFILLAAASYMFIYSLIDYALNIREYDKAVHSYRGVFSVESSTVFNPNNPIRPFFLLSDESNKANYDGYFKYEDYHQLSIKQEQIDQIMSFPYVTSINKRYLTAGVSLDYYRIYKQNTDFYKGFFTYSARCVFEATLDKIDKPLGEAYAESLKHQGEGLIFENLFISNVKILAGDSAWLLPDKETIKNQYRIRVTLVTPLHFEVSDFVGERKSNLRPLIIYRNNHFTEGELAKLVLGERYIFAARVEPLAYIYAEGGELFPAFFFGDDTLYDWWPYAYPLKDLPYNYLELDEFRSLQELIQVTNDDYHTLDTVYTDDMKTIRRVAEEKILITEGRLLTPSDNESKNPVCVVSDVFMKENKLKIGDKIKLRLGDKLFEQYAPLGAVASTRGRYADNFTEEEFEIVGAYIDLNIDKMRNLDLYWAYSDYTVFVPLSFLPDSAETENHEFKPAELSFIVGNALDIKAFMEECIPQIEAMGFIVYFNDGGWLKLEEQFKQAKTLSLTKLIAFTAAAILASVLTVYLFIGRKKREYAIMRALGTTKRRTNRTLFIPFMLLAVIGVSIGGVIAALNISNTAVETLKQFAEMGLEVNSSVPISVIVLGIISLYILLSILASSGLYRLSKKPPLMLLQENTNRNTRIKQRQKKISEPNDNEYIKLISTNVKIHELKPLETGIYSSVTQTLSYIFKHSRRALVKSLLSLMLAALLFGAMGQFTAVRQSYSELYQNIVIKARYINGLPYGKALSIAKTDYVHSPYYEFILAGEACYNDIQYEHADFFITSDITRLTKEPIEYLEGYDEATIMSLDERICLMQKNMMELMGLKLGDMAELNVANYMDTVITYHRDYTEEERIEAYHKHSFKCKIVAVLPNSVGTTIGIPIAAEKKLWSLVYPLILDLAEYTLSDYHQADEFRKYSEDVIYTVRDNQPLFIMDTTEADNIYKIYKLIEALYPIAVAVAVLLGAVLPGLIIIQTAKEASILRVLGTTKRRTRVMLILEQLMLCLIGLILAFAVLGVVNRAVIIKVIEPLGTYCLLHLIGCTVGTTLAAITVTRKKILELLQVKE